MLSGMMADCDECGAIYSMKVGALNGMIYFECGRDLIPWTFQKDQMGISTQKGLN